MDAKEEKKEEYYKGKEVKGKLEKKKEEVLQGQGSQRRKIAVHPGKLSHDRRGTSALRVLKPVSIQKRR